MPEPKMGGETLGVEAGLRSQAAAIKLAKGAVESGTLPPNIESVLQGVPKGEVERFMAHVEEALGHTPGGSKIAGELKRRAGKRT